MNCVATIAHGPAGRALFEESKPLMLAYADRCKAVLDSREWGGPWAMTHQLRVGALLDDYDRVLYLDADCLVRADCPNLFDLAPETHFAAHDEMAHFSPGHTRKACDYMAAVCAAERLPVPEVHGRFFNFGVLLFGGRHRFLFEPPSAPCPLGGHPWHAQALLNVRLFNSGLPVYHLPQCFNCSPGLTSDRHYARSNWIVHLAGMGLQGEEVRLQKMRKIVAFWKSEGLA